MTLEDMRTGQDMKDLQTAANIFMEYVPKENWREINRKRNKHYGFYSFENAKKMLNEYKDEEGAAAQLNETIKLDSEIVYENLDFLAIASKIVPAHRPSCLDNSLLKTFIMCINSRISNNALEMFRDLGEKA